MSGGRAGRFAAALAFFVISQSLPVFANSSFTLSAWIRPKSVVPSSPVVVCTSDAAQWSDGFGIYLEALCAEDVAALWREGAAATARPAPPEPQPAEAPPAAPSASPGDAVSTRLADRLKNLGRVSTRQRVSATPRLRVFTELSR